MYGHVERTTIDNEWTYDELKGDLKDEIFKYMSDNNVTKRYENRAVYDEALAVYDDYASIKVEDEICAKDGDLIDAYNKQYHKRRAENKFGIHYFDEYVVSVYKRLLKENEVRR